MRFKVKAGKHVGEDGTNYKTGSVVESFDDLTKLFPEKFERLPGGEEEPESEEPEAFSSAPAPKPKAPARKPAKE